MLQIKERTLIRLVASVVMVLSVVHGIITATQHSNQKQTVREDANLQTQLETESADCTEARCLDKKRANWPLSITWPLSNPSEIDYRDACCIDRDESVLIARIVTIASLKNFVSSNAIKHLTIIADSLTCCDNYLDQVTLFNVTIIANTVRITGPNTVQDCCIVAQSVVLQAQSLEHNSLFGERLDVSVVHYLHRNVLISKLLRVTTSGTQAAAQSNIMIADGVRFASDITETDDFDASGHYFHFEKVLRNVFVFNTGEIGSSKLPAEGTFFQNSVVGKKAGFYGYANVYTNTFVLSQDLSLKYNRKEVVSFKENKIVCDLLIAHRKLLRDSKVLCCKRFQLNNEMLADSLNCSYSKFENFHVNQVSQKLNSSLEINQQKLIGLLSFSISTSNPSFWNESNFWLAPLLVLRRNLSVVNPFNIKDYFYNRSYFHLDAAFSVNQGQLKLVEEKLRKFIVASVVSDEAEARDLQWLASVLPHDDTLFRNAEQSLPKQRKNNVTALAKHAHFNCSARCNIRNLILVASSVSFELSTENNQMFQLLATIIVADIVTITSVEPQEVTLLDSFVLAREIRVSGLFKSFLVKRCQIFSNHAKLENKLTSSSGFLVETSFFFTYSVYFQSASVHQLTETFLLTKYLKFSQNSLKISNSTILAEDADFRERFDNSMANQSFEGSFLIARRLNIQSLSLTNVRSELFADRLSVKCGTFEALNYFDDCYLYGGNFSLEKACITENKEAFASAISYKERMQINSSQLSASVKAAVLQALHADNNDIVKASVAEVDDVREADDLENFFDLPQILLQELVGRLKAQCLDKKTLENYQLSTFFASPWEPDERFGFRIELMTTFSPLQKVANAIVSVLALDKCDCMSSVAETRKNTSENSSIFVEFFVGVLLMLNFVVILLLVALVFKKYIFTKKERRNVICKQPDLVTETKLSMTTNRIVSYHSLQAQ